ncbi:uncharacterized protein SCHCODRAFT_02611904 [Schizophyllum commune H4-8]|uniref:uncharacterized protein n=1 Tax=Schizophyllum commune (strain H4-8 / FGSC 9210) TaxID=578458 RepID=UPI00215E1DF9|nr:uncharacterized protein SCHCODRAFT_02611904 [Schizophyllum commune H4-8]KAI5898375.1 hypothetical protein SCHCODRAFT_02611904 [Schizophyllum commune H4-8]
MFVAFSGLLIPASLDTSRSMATVAEDVVQAASPSAAGADRPRSHRHRSCRRSLFL